MHGNKVDFTNGVFKNMKVTEIDESSPSIEKIHTQTNNISNDHISIPIELPSYNKSFVSDIISIETYIGINESSNIGLNNNFSNGLNKDLLNNILPIGLNKDSLNNFLSIGLNKDSKNEDDLYN
jgi:hypothetical protein